MKTSRFAATLLAAALLLAACRERTELQPVTATPAPATAPADVFLTRIAEHCNQAFAGRITANEPPPTADDPFTGKTLVMHVRECSENEIKIPFHVGDDHSRTWVLTRTASGLRLKHDHRHEDGTEDEVTMYGGDTATPGTAIRQEFPVDQHSIQMFQAAGLTASVVNVWAMEIEPGQRFLYELARPEQGRLFRVEFDLTTPVPAPPTPWGHPELEAAGPPDASL
ncbi:MAG TPA: hypothetical protein VMT00_04680 [Thermoanaerobaculia bacterium]|nr:hypothetical protein [Thermoanaerobaculia bacterium]